MMGAHPAATQGGLVSRRGQHGFRFRPKMKRIHEIDRSFKLWCPMPMVRRMRVTDTISWLASTTRADDSEDDWDNAIRLNDSEQLYRLISDVMYGPIHTTRGRH